MAAYGSSTDLRHLEKHGKQYRAKLDVPRKLREIVGKAALKKSLGTDSLSEAQRLRWSALAELRKQLHEAARKAKAAPLDPIVAEALRTKEYLATDMDPEQRELITDLVHWDRREEIEREHGKAAAEQYFHISMGHSTPITVHLDDWAADLQGSGKRKRTIKEYRRSVEELAAYAAQEGLPQTLQAFGRRHAGTLISKRFIQPQVDPKTSSKFISALSSYWRWLESRGFIPLGTDNPWLRQPKPKQKKGGKAARQKERPFTDDEISTLLDPSASAGDLTLQDFMLIAALSGMRIEEIASLKVEDVDLKKAIFTVEEAKTEAGIRIVPIHPKIEGIIKRRIEGRAKGDWLFPELPEYPPESLSERSMVVSKRFVTYRRRLGVDDRVPGKRRSLVNFHSFRRWFITKAERAGIPKSTVSFVVGHEEGREGMTFGVYSAGPSLDQLRECVRAVKLPRNGGQASGGNSHGR